MNIQQRFQKVLSNIIDTKLQFGYVKTPIDLLAVSKKHPAESIRALYHLGQKAFGESYFQEAINKQNALQDCDIDWHFIGPIQSNKAKLISQHFTWVHSVCREKIDRLLNDARINNQAPLNILIQIKINDEKGKEGIQIDEAHTFCTLINDLPNLRLRGFMAIPQKATDFAKQKKNFALLHKLYNQHQAQFQLDTLSMGMSNDYKAAISEGSTMIRIGTDIFGPRQ